MSTVSIVLDAIKDLEKESWTHITEETCIDVYTAWDVYDERRIYLGSWFSLDPCGRYHNVLSPNGVTRRCERFWESFERQAEKRGYHISAGEGDPTDIYFVQFRDCACTPEEENGE